MPLNFKLILFIDALLIVATAMFYFSLARPWRVIVAPLYVIPALLVPVVGLIAHDKNVFYAYVFCVPFLSLGDPKKLACIYLLMLSQFPELLQQWLLGPVYVADLSAIHFLNLGAFAALAFTRGPKLRPVGSIDAVAWLLFLLCATFSARGLAFNSVLRQTLQSFLLIIPPYYVISRSIRSPQAATEAILLFVFGGMCNAVVAIFEARRSWPLYEQINYQLGIPPDLSATLAIRSGFLRAQGAVSSPTVVGLLFAFTLIACFTMKGRFSRTGQWIVATALLFGMGATQSRGAFLATGAGLILYWAYTYRTTRVLALASAVLLGWAIVTALPEQGTVSQLLGRSGDAHFTANYRSDLFRRGLEEVAKHPFTGQSMNELNVSMNDMRQGQHIVDFVNSHLFVALALGIPGLVVWLLAWSVPLRVGWRARPDKAARATPLPIEFPFAMVGASFVGLTFTSWVDRLLPWTLIAFGFVAAFVAINRLKVAPADYRAPAPLVELPPLARITQAA